MMTVFPLVLWTSPSFLYTGFPLPVLFFYTIFFANKSIAEVEWETWMAGVGVTLARPNFSPLVQKLFLAKSPSLQASPVNAA